LDRGVVRINNSNYTAVYDGEGTVEIQHATGHQTLKSPIMTVIHEYIKKTPGTIYGFHEEHVIEVVLRLSVCRTDLVNVLARHSMEDVPRSEALPIPRVSTDDIQIQAEVPPENKETMKASSRSDIF
jgi:hypothetical protein